MKNLSENTNDKVNFTIEERVKFYQKTFKECKALSIVKNFIQPMDKIEALEAIRKLNTDLSDAYMVPLPVITCWVRDDNYVPATQEIYLTEPEIKAFLHQFRHHLQNIERRYERRGLTTEGNLEIADIPYTRCYYSLYGEDDARAWVKFLTEN